MRSETDNLSESGPIAYHIHLVKLLATCTEGKNANTEIKCHSLLSLDDILRVVTHPDCMSEVSSDKYIFCTTSHVDEQETWLDFNAEAPQLDFFFFAFQMYDKMDKYCLSKLSSKCIYIYDAYMVEVFRQLCCIFSLFDHDCWCDYDECQNKITNEQSGIKCTLILVVFSAGY